MRFKNPANNYVEELTAPWLWTLLFGPLYFASRGVWSHALISLVLALLTAGVSWLIYPFFASVLVQRHYLRSGWVPVPGTQSKPLNHRPLNKALAVSFVGIGAVFMAAVAVESYQRMASMTPEQRAAIKEQRAAEKAAEDVRLQKAALAKEAEETDAKAKRQAVKDHFLTKEKTAKDALWTSDSTFKVGVIDDGSPRDGYAEYVCIVIAEHGISGPILVRVIDIVRLTRKKEWVNLGTATCR